MKTKANIKVAVRLRRDQIEWIDQKAMQLGVGRSEALRFLIDRDRSWDDAR